MVTLNSYLILSAVLFAVGVAGVLVRRNAIIIFMSIELMLNAVNLTFVAFSHYLHSLDGQIFVFMVMAVAAAEVAVGLALIIAIYRIKSVVNVDEIANLALFLASASLFWAAARGHAQQEATQRWGCGVATGLL